MRRRTLILPTIAVTLAVLVACQEPAADPVEPKKPQAETVEKKTAGFKYPISVDDAKSRANATDSEPASTENDSTAKGVVLTTPEAKATPESIVEPTPTPIPEPSPEPAAEEPSQLTGNLPATDPTVDPTVDPTTELSNNSPEVDSDFAEYTDIETGEAMPTPADELAYADLIPLGVYNIVHYSAEACGNNIGARERPGGMVEGDSVAMPEWWMLGKTVLVEGYGFYTVDDISPAGVADIFHYCEKDAVGCDWQQVYLVVEE